MKRVIAIVLTILFFLLIIAALLFKLFGTSSSESPNTAPTQTSFPVSAPVGAAAVDPGVFVKSFYVWYLSNAANDPLFPHPENREVVLKDWLTDSFIADWDQIQSDSEANPVLLTGGDTSSWSSNISAVTTAQLTYTSSVRVALGPPSEGHVFTVQLTRTSGSTWKIDSITNAF